MDAERFVRAAKAYGVTLLEEEAAQIAAPWRHDHPMIVQLWLAIQETVEALFQRCYIRLSLRLRKFQPQTARTRTAAHRF